jgi:hypothetical protein
VLPDGGQVDPLAWNALRVELMEAVTFAKTVGRMERDERARELWHQVYGPLSAGGPGLADAAAGRPEAHVTRLSLVYALMDKSDVIRREHLVAALALWDYADKSIRYLFGDVTGDPLADDILLMLLGRREGATRTEIYNWLSRNTSAARIAKALRALARAGKARREKVRVAGACRPVERWYAVTRVEFDASLYQQT